MPVQHPIILYVGDPQRGQAFEIWAEAHEWLVYRPQEVMEALGLYITYMPDITILDADALPETVAEVYFHLRSVEANPLLVLTHDLDWDIDADEDVYTVSPVINNYELMETIGDLLNLQPMLMPQL